MTKDDFLKTLDSYQRIALHSALGPGDTLRFVHMIQMMNQSQKKRTLVLTSNNHKSRHIGLFGFGRSKQVVDKLGTLVKEGDVHWLESKELNAFPAKGAVKVLQALGITPAVMKQKYGGEIITCFQSLIEQPASYDQKTVDGYILKRHDDDKTMNAGKYQNTPPVNQRNTAVGKLKILFLVRDTPMGPNGPLRPDKWRDTPQSMIDILADITRSQETRADVTVVGDKLDNLKPGWVQRPYTGEDYAQQIKSNQSFDAIIGVNSGGLDLAAAAGIPVLRFSDSYSGKEKYKNFNKYLSTALNISVMPNGRKDEGWFDENAQKQFRNAVTGFLKLIKSGSVEARAKKFVLIDHKTISWNDILNKIQSVNS